MKKIKITLITLLFAISGFAQEYSYKDVTKTNLPQDLNVHSMDSEFLDVDEDGDLDVVIAVEGGKNLLLLNDGKGNFTHSYALTDRVEDSEDIGIADFNGDGHVDILFVAEDTKTNELYFGDGKGNFTPVNARIFIHDRSNAVFVEDLNLDGSPDIIIGSSIAKDSEGINRFLINDGKGNFTDETEKRIPMIKDDTQDLIMGDVNGDGFPDLVVANEDENRMYFNRGDGTFTDESHRLNIRKGVREVTREVCLSDVDVDGDLDIVFFNTAGDKQTRLFINDGKGNFTDETDSRIPKDNSRTWDGGMYDVNNDGLPDIITANSDGKVSGELYGVYLNDGRGYFVNQTSMVFPPSVKGSGWDVEAADLNNDGLLDFYLCARANNKDGSWSQDLLLFGEPGKATKVGKTQPISSDRKQFPTLATSDYHIMRGNLNNSLMKIEQGRKKIRVAFVGGSITNMKGWRYMMQNYLQNRFPKTEFDFIQAGVPSMGSTSDAFRFSRDVVFNGPVDLIFIEAAVNDNRKGKTDEEIRRGMEGMVRHARYVGPATDIIFMYFVDQDKIEDYKNDKVPHVIADHESVAKYYNIPAINLAKEVAERIDAGEITWNKDIRSVHVALPGQRIYRNSMINFLENMWKDGLSKEDKIVEYTIPEKLDDGCYDRGYFVDATKLDPIDGWKYYEIWDPEFKVGTRRNYYHVPMLIGSYPGKIFTFEFEGNAVGILDVSGPNAGIIEYRIDKGEWGKLDLFNKYSSRLYLPWYFTLGAGLHPGHHKLEIRMASEKNPDSKGNVCHLRYFYVNR